MLINQVKFNVLSKRTHATIATVTTSLKRYYSDVTMTNVSIVCSTVYSGADQRKHQSSASLACARGIQRWTPRGFPSQRASNAEKVFIWWRHHWKGSHGDHTQLTVGIVTITTWTATSVKNAVSTSAPLWLSPADVVANIEIVIAAVISWCHIPRVEMSLWQCAANSSRLF